jgi:plastocyanin
VIGNSGTGDRIRSEQVIGFDRNPQFTVSSIDAGMYRFYCHLHPGHIGGQLVVFGN